MATPREIKLRIGAVEKIRKIASALEVVSLTRLRRIETKTEKAGRYFDSIRELAFDISNNLVYEAHPFLRARPEEKIKRRAIIAVSSDKGLCGDFNTNITREINLLLSEKNGAGLVVFAIGKKAGSFLRRKGLAPKAEYASSSKDIDYMNVGSEIAAMVADMFLKKDIDEAVIIYNRFKRQFLGRPRRLRILPLKIKGFSIKRVRDYMYEPGPYAVLDRLLMRYIANQIGQVILESGAAEEMARMLAMKKARDNAEEAIGALNRTYHKQRQMRITRELIDIATAANA